MHISTRILRWLLSLLLAAGLGATASAQQRPPQLWDPTRTDPQYEARKWQAVRASNSPAKPARVRATALPRPACFEPFDTTATGGWTQIPRGDDTSYGPINLGWDFSLFGIKYREVYVNINGNITFDRPLTSFNAAGFPISTPMIAPFWADVDTRNPASGTIWFKVFPDRLVVVWNRVGYFGNQADRKNTFQLVIKANTAPNFSGNDVLMSYDDMQWTTGSASQGIGGFGGVPATVGANRGNSVDYIQTGRFNLDSRQAPNQPSAGDPGGVGWLDGQCLSYQVRGTDNSVVNVPPAVAGMPADNAITVAQGETRTVSLQFSGPETNQTVTVSTATNGLCNATASTTGNGGTNPAVTFTVTGAACNVGTTTVRFTATDNGLPSPLQVVFPLQVTVSPPVANGIWTGAVSTDWATAGNWSNSVLPTNTLNVTIPATAPRMPVLSGAGTAASLTAVSGATLTISNSGVLTLAGALTSNGAALTMNGSGTLLVGGTLTLAGGSLNLGSGSSRVQVGGDLVRAAGATLTAGPVSTVTLNGTGPQRLDLKGATLANLTVNNAAGVSLPALSNTDVSGTLTLTSGAITTDVSATLRLLNGATMVGEQRTQYVRGNLAAVKAAVPAGAATTFANGFVLTPAATLMNLTVTRRAGLGAAHASYGLSSNGLNKGIDQIWQTSQSVTGQVQLSWLAANDNGLNRFATSQAWARATAPVAGSDWFSISGSQNAANSRMVTGTVPAEAPVSFFTVGTTEAPLGGLPLPVTLVSFEARWSGRAAQLTWRTAAELHNDRFEVERSPDGQTFGRIGTVAGQGTSNRPTAYRFTDEPAAIPVAGQLVYYRLRQVDTDGTATFSPVRVLAVEAGEPAATLRLVPNPARGQVLVAGATGPVEVLDLTGRVVRQQPGSGTIMLTGLPAGVYVVRSGARAARLVIEQ